MKVEDCPHPPYFFYQFIHHLFQLADYFIRVSNDRKVVCVKGCDLALSIQQNLLDLSHSMRALSVADLLAASS